MPSVLCSAALTPQSEAVTASHSYKPGPADPAVTSPPGAKDMAHTALRFVLLPPYKLIYNYKLIINL